MENSETAETSDLLLYFQPSDFSEEYDHYDENVDDYDFNEDNIYDDGIAKSVQDDEWEDGDEDEGEEYIPESGISPYDEDFEDSLRESEDYDELDD